LSRNGHPLCCVSPTVCDRLINPSETCGQMLGRGLDPCLSTGTLQLSIRCSSIHFLPRRSFPVSGADEVAASGVGWPGRELSWPAAGSASPTARNTPSVPMYSNRMNGLASVCRRCKRAQLNNREVYLTTRNLRLADRFSVGPAAPGAHREKEDQMNIKRIILAGCFRRPSRNPKGRRFGTRIHWQQSGDDRHGR